MITGCVVLLSAIVGGVALPGGPAPRIVGLLAPAQRSAWLNVRTAAIVRDADLSHVLAYPLASAISLIVLGAIFGAVFAGPVGMAGGAAVAVVLPGFAVARRIGRRSQRVRAALPDVVEAVARGLRSGESTSHSVSSLVETFPTPVALRLDLIEIRRRLTAGATVAEAVGWWVRSTALVDVALFDAALALGSQVGGDQASALDELAAALRAASGAEAEATAMAAQGRLSAQVIAAAPLGVFCVVGVTDPSALAYFVSPLGAATLLTGLVLNGFGLWWMRSIVGSP